MNITLCVFSIKSLKSDSSSILSSSDNVGLADNEERRFTANERKYLNLKVIKALRDVEGDMRNLRTSPVKKMTSDSSLGINNILYISLIMQMLQDKTVPTLKKKSLLMNLL